MDFYALDSHANGDPRKALALATEVCTDPEAENRLLGFFGGISSEESKSVQVQALPIPSPLTTLSPSHSRVLLMTLMLCFLTGI